MISQIDVGPNAGTPGSSAPDVDINRTGFFSLLFLTAWCGLVAGLLEVATIVLRKQFFDPDRLYKLSRYFVWLIPLVNLGIFLALGLLGCAIIVLARQRGRWLVNRALGAMTVLPLLLVAFPRIYTLAFIVVALGMAARLVPFLERNARTLRKLVRVTLPIAATVVVSLAATIWIGDRIKQSRASARPVPPAGSPNVLLLVMDTVAARHLGLFGYHRATSTTLSELAERGIRFDSARSASSWTLPSHAIMFTGRWLHELSVGWLTPLDQAQPTLAEFLGAKGYATAGFIANTFYCAADSGLARGFTRYQDYSFPELTVLKTAVLVSRALEGFQTIAYFTEDWLETARLMPYVERVWRALDTDRKGASAVNRELLAWLDARGQQERPFFAFLNYFDAHFPYQLQPGRVHRFGVEPTDNYQRILIQHWWELDKSTLSPEGVAFANDAYDDCIADLDEQIGKLVDELERHGVLGRTWLIIASDHGESFGEHAGIFCHGKSLYESELHVPLLFIPPGGNATPQAVKEPVSLRDLAATIVDLTGQQAGAPFPGTSLARLWKPRAQVVGDQPGIASPALAEVVPNDVFNRDAWGVPNQLPPLGALKDEDWSYIRREGDAGDELFHLRRDPREQHNLAADPSAQLTLKQMRAALDRLTEGPLVSKRFKD
jgi:arylsulfatase A-like enzyme